MTPETELQKLIRHLAEDSIKMKQRQVKTAGCLVQVQSALYAINATLSIDQMRKTKPELDELYDRIDALLTLLKDDPQ